MGKSPLTGRGFALVELMIALVVGAILLGLAIPSFSSMLQRNRVNTTENYLYTSLNAAREEAIKRRSAVRVCPSSDGAACRNDGNWSQGWLIFVDANANNAPDGAEIVKVVNAIHASVSLSADNAISGHVQFNPAGDAFGTAGEFRICHADSLVASKAVRISPAGRVESAYRVQTTCGAEVEEGSA